MDTTTASIANRRTRNTQQRRAVLEAAQRLAGTHPTAAEIFQSVRSHHPQMSLATVYRSLHALVQQNALCELRIENTSRYDAGPCPHHHLICRQCGCVTDICAESLPHAAITMLQTQLTADGFALDPFPIQFSGICPDCRQAAQN